MQVRLVTVTKAKYEILPSLTLDAIFSVSKSSRINAANFMSRLSVEEGLYEKWKGKCLFYTTLRLSSFSYVLLRMMSIFGNNSSFTYESIIKRIITICIAFGFGY
jgi:hypothetical protein